MRCILQHDCHLLLEIVKPLFTENNGKYGTGCTYVSHSQHPVTELKTFLHIQIHDSKYTVVCAKHKSSVFIT